MSVKTTVLHSAWLAGALALGVLSACGAEGGDKNPGTGASGPNAGTGADAGTGAGGQSGGGGSGATACGPLDPVPARIWRLSIAQFSNSVRDLLGLEQGPSVNNAGGSSEYAFFSDTAGAVDQTLAFNIHEAVTASIELVMPRLPALVGCTAGEAEPACAERFAASFGRRAFRRDLDAAEVTDLMKVYTEGRKQDFNTGIKLMLKALLQSPSFLYRSEIGDPGATETALTAYEVATQLGFFFLNSTPDLELLDAAGDGRLATPEGIREQIDRLLTLEPVKQNISRVVLDWFGVRQALSKTTKSAVLLGALPPSLSDQNRLTSDLVTSTQMFIDEVLWRGSGDLDGLITSRRVFVNQRLAALYGIPFASQPEQFVGADFPEAQQRAGLLTQPGVLWAVSDPEVTSIVHRGLYVHNDLLCLDPVPSPGALLEDPDIKAALAMLPTEIDKSNYRMNVNQQCKGCHSQIDPFALILEGFDPVGAHRTVADGKPVDPTGTFALSPSLMGNVTGAPAFAQGIVADSLLTACAAQKISSYAIGRMIRRQATCEVKDVHARFSATDRKVTSLFREVAAASFVRTRIGGAQ